MMFYKKNSEDYISPLTGVELKTLTYGEKMSMTEFKMIKGGDLPPHVHPHEQIGILISGLIELKIGDEVFRAEPGDSWSIPGGVEHSAAVLEDSIAIEVFAPVREDYIK